MTNKNDLYKAKFGKDIPNRYKNDNAWIDEKLGLTNEPTQETVELAATEPLDEINIEKEEPNVAPVVVKQEVKKTENVTATVNDVMSSHRDSYEGIQAFHGFTNNEAFMGDLDRYPLNAREKEIIATYINNKTQKTELSNLNYGLFKDWVKPVIEKHGLTSNDILSEDTLENKIYESYLAMEKKKGEDITPAIQADLLAKSKQEAQTVISHNTMLKNDLKRKDKQWLK